MRPISILLTLALLLGLLTGCQPTPETSAVVSKQESIAEATEATDEDQLADIPATVEEASRTLTDRLTVVMDAAVSVPEGGALPVARLTKQGIDQETGERWLAALAEGRTPYYLRTLGDYSIQELTDIVEEIRTTGDLPVRVSLMESVVAGSEEETIASVEAYLDTASAEPQYDYFSSGDPVLNRSFEFDSDYAVCVAEIANGQYALRFRCYDIMWPDGLVTGLDQQSQSGVTISEAEAVAEAEALLDEMGLTEFTLDAAGWIPYSDRDTETVESYEEYPKCYALYFTKQIGGMNETYVDPTYVRLANREDSYNAVWEPEYIRVTVADEGILSVDIPEYPSQVEVLADNVEILPFEDILDRFYEQIKLSGCWVDESEDEIIEKRTVYIDEIVLGGMRTIEKDADTYLYVPVWSFFGSVVTQYKEGMGDPNQVDENNAFTNRDYRQCVLTLSAIDGRVIDRAQGY